MPDTTISALPAGTASAGWKAPADDAAGTATYYVTLGAIAFLMNDASNLTNGTLPDARLSANVVLTTDVRMTNNRAPTAHAGTHATGGTDVITPTSIGAAAATHASAHATGGADAITPASIGASASGHTHVYSTLTGIPSSFTPSTHASTHAPNGADPVLPRSVTLSLTGTNNNLDVSGYDIVRITSAANVTITGLTASPVVPVLIVNENAAGGATVTLAHESASSTATNRIRNTSLADATIQPDGGTAVLVQSPVINRWRT